MGVNIASMTFNNFMRHVVEAVGNTSLEELSKRWMETGIQSVSDVKYVMTFLPMQGLSKMLEGLWFVLYIFLRNCFDYKTHFKLCSTVDWNSFKIRLKPFTFFRLKISKQTNSPHFCQHACWTTHRMLLGLWAFTVYT